MANSIDGAPKSTYRVFDFKGGLNTQYRNTALSDNESTDLLNVDFSSRGAIKQRAGLRIYRSSYFKTGHTIVGMTQFVKEDDKINYFFVETKDGTNKRRLYANNVEVNFVDVSNNPLTVDPTASPFAIFAFGNTVYFVNNKNGGFTYDTNLKRATLTPSIPKASKVLIHNSRAFYYGIAGTPNYIQYSIVGNPIDMSITVGGTSTGAGGTLKTTDQDYEITGVAIFNNSLIIFKQNNVYSIDMTSDHTLWVKKSLNVASGCIDGRTIARSDNQLFYLGGDGVRVIRNTNDSIVESIPVSEKITPDMTKAINDFRANGTTIMACAKGSRYYLAMNQDTYVFDELLGAWTKHDFSFNSHVRTPESDVICFGFDDGYMRIFDETLLNDEVTPNVFSPIDAYYSSAFLFLEEPEVTKRFRMLKAYYKPNDVRDSKIDVKVEIDYKDDMKSLNAEYIGAVWDETVWDESNWDEPKEEVVQSIRFSGTGHSIRVTFSNDAINETLSIHGFVLVYKRKRKVR